MLTAEVNLSFRWQNVEFFTALFLLSQLTLYTKTKLMTCKRHSPRLQKNLSSSILHSKQGASNSPPVTFFVKRWRIKSASNFQFNYRRPQPVVLNCPCCFQTSVKHLNTFRKLKKKSKIWNTISYQGVWKRYGEDGGRDSDCSTSDMHNANDMHVKWKNKLTVTEQWSSQRAASLAWITAGASSIYLHEKTPFTAVLVSWNFPCWE